MKRNHLTWNIFFLVVLNDGVEALAQLVMKKGLITTGMTCVTFANFAEFVVRNASSFLVWLGILIYALSFFIWIVVLYKIDLSVAMPLGSVSYILVPLAAIVFLHEHVDIVRWVGIVCVVFGIYFVSKSHD